MILRGFGTCFLAALVVLTVPDFARADDYSGPGCELDARWDYDLKAEIKVTPTCKYVPVMYVLTASDEALREVYQATATTTRAGEYSEYRESYLFDLADATRIPKAISANSWVVGGYQHPFSYAREDYSFARPLDGEIDRTVMYRDGPETFLKTKLVPKRWYEEFVAPHTRLDDQAVWYPERGGAWRSEETDWTPKGYYWDTGRTVVTQADFYQNLIELSWKNEDLVAPWYHVPRQGEPDWIVSGYVPVINPLRGIEVVYRLELDGKDRLVLRLWKQIDHLEDGTKKETVYKTVGDMPSGATLAYFDLGAPTRKSDANIGVEGEAPVLATSTPVIEVTASSSENTKTTSWWETLMDFLFGWLSR